MDGAIFYFLDENLDILAAVDIYKSAIFTGRYYEPGDFELYMPATTEALALAKSSAFVTRADKTEVCGIVEKVGISTSAEEGDFVTVSGRDAAALLERRIVWKQTTYSGKAEKIVRDLITTAFITPEIAARTVSNLVLGAEIGLNDRIRVQYTGDTVGSAVQAICRTTGTGYRIKLDLPNKRFIFELYQGADRSFSQNTNPFVIFSEDFDNLIASSYEEDASGAKNVAQVAGSGEGNDRVKVAVGTASGISRVEAFINATLKSDNAGELDELTYKGLLAQDGTQKLAELAPTKQVDGEIAPNYTFEFGRDYFLGDIIEVMNQYGFDFQPRIAEVIESWNEEGYTCIPTFEQPTETA